MTIKKTIQVPPHILSDDVAAHRWLCHANGSECEDGCDVAADPRRAAAYTALPEQDDYFAGCE